MPAQHPIGVFDSGFGGLTVLRSIVDELPDFDYCYLGDNARAPYGTRSFETVYQYTLQSVRWLFEQGCPLVILACNTASAKALRSIQQKDLPIHWPQNRVLGVIRPSSEIIGTYTHSGKIGILATKGTVSSESYPIEIAKFYPATEVFQHACPMWVPLVENGEFDGPGADYFVKKDIEALLETEKGIDTVLLACTHYPLLENKIREHLPSRVQLISQGEIVAKSLENYLERHPEMAERISRKGGREFYTSDDPGEFNRQAGMFFGEPVKASHIELR